MSDSEEIRLLKVDVLEARDLLASNKDGTSDCYATVGFLDPSGHELKKEKKITKVIQRTVAPSWNESFLLGECSGMLQYLVY